MSKHLSAIRGHDDEAQRKSLLLMMTASATVPNFLRFLAKSQSSAGQRYWEYMSRDIQEQQCNDMQVSSSKGY